MGMMPSGAMPILKARKQGKRPAEMVLVSMVGDLPEEANPYVIAAQDIAYDWGWIKGLTVCFWVSPKGYIAKHVLECFKASPSEVYLWDCENKRGYDIHVLPTVESIERPRDQWNWKVDALRWLPFQEKHFELGEIE